MTDEYIWPVRNVAEYAYCPRLFYLMEVEGIHIPNADTEEGKAVHKRVDKPSAKRKFEDTSTEDENKPTIVRSLTLTSQTLGITGTLDIAEISGMTAVPVEYRKGRPRKLGTKNIANEEDEITVEPWPADKVQMGLQALLLKDAGYTVPRAVIYYAAERKRVEMAVNESLENEAFSILNAARQAASSGVRPTPLLNDSRCVRCSLQPVCLPDEVNYQSSQIKKCDIKPRKIWPPRDDGIHIVAQSAGVKVGVQGEALRVVENNGNVLNEMPLANVESVSVLGSVQITTQAIHTLAERNIPVAFMSGAGRMVAMIDPLDSVSAEIRRAQVRNFDKPEKCLALSQALISAKVINQRTLLMRNNKSAIENTLTDLAREAGSAKKAPSIDAVRSHEGQAAALYFQNFGGMFSGPLADEFSNNGRQRRPPPDPINACLSLAYTLLTHECTAALRLARLEPSIGAFHVSRPGRPAFSLDLMEPFRPLIADSIAITAFNKGELTEGHFQRTVAGCVMTEAGRKAFFNAYGRRMDMEITHPVFGYKLSYRRMLTLHARMIAAWLTEEISTLAFLTTR